MDIIARLNLKIEEMEMPELVVFDLDYTLWPFWCDTHVSPPFEFNRTNHLLDRKRFHINLYTDVLGILTLLNERGVLMAVASRTETPHIAMELLRLLGLERFFKFKEIYPGTKLKHFKQFNCDSGIDYNKMLFFDDEMRNISEVGGIGVTAQIVPNGLCERNFIEGIEKYNKNSL